MCNLNFSGLRFAPVEQVYNLLAIDPLLLGRLKTCPTSNLEPLHNAMYERRTNKLKALYATAVAFAVDRESVDRRSKSRGPFVRFWGSI